MKIKTISFLAAAAVAALFAGCEWTSSDGDPTWSGSYSEGGDMVEGMNFSGTYRNDARGGCAVLTKSSSGDTVTTTNGDNILDEFTWNDGSDITFTLRSKPKLGTIKVELHSSLGGGKTIVWDDLASPGILKSSTPDMYGSGNVGGTSITIKGFRAIANKGDPVTVTYEPEGTSSAPVVSGSGAVLAITVSQSGSNLKFTTSNGVTMSGAITTVSVYSNSTSVTYSAQFNVSGSGNTMVGTLDDRTGGQNRLNGTWTSGAAIYDVNGFCATTTGSSTAE